MNEVIELLDERTRPLKVTEYVALAELGVFDEERVELLRGRVVKMSPQGEEHSFVMGSLTNLLVEHFGKWATADRGCRSTPRKTRCPSPTSR